MNADQQLCQIVAKLLELPEDEVTPERTIESYGVWDSLRHLEIITEVEDTFDVMLDMDAIMEVECIGDIRKAIEAAQS